MSEADESHSASLASRGISLVERPGLAEELRHAAGRIVAEGFDSLSLLSLMTSVAASHARTRGVSREDYRAVCDAVWEWAEAEFQPGETCIFSTSAPEAPEAPPMEERH